MYRLRNNRNIMIYLLPFYWSLKLGSFLLQKKSDKLMSLIIKLGNRLVIY
nr:MAG TPA: hypothetical protein [Caudoviricetes sp.]